jgi:hypothetical protein
MHKSEPKRATARAIQRLKDWSRPKTVPMGHFEKAANGLEDIPNDKWNNVSSYKPMIVPRGMFGQLSNPTTAAPESVRPQMVPFGGLQQAALEKVWQEGNISEAIRLEKEGKFADGELQGACKLMESTKNIAMLIHREESSPEGKTLPTREGVLALMKIVCPVLKLTYPFVTRCIKVSGAREERVRSE